ncbi:MAG: hypothetical protein HYT43_00780 [Candidatus Taylorbacteria bacterium]|nr:hypothetical protein [Candidatus Taylorbacteria bacterium]
MLITNTKRIIKSGFMNFWRNGFVSLASVLIMIIALFVIGSVIFGTALLKNVLGELKDKADINVYFVTDATEGDILSLKQSLENLPQVAFVAYTSREEAFARFKERHKDDELMSQVFDILGENPLGASLTVKAREVSGYEAIAGFLTKENDALSRDSRSIIDEWW